MNKPLPADAKALALSYALLALVKTLSDAGVIHMDQLFSNLAGAQSAAMRSGETEAAELLAALAENWQSVG